MRSSKESSAGRLASPETIEKYEKIKRNKRANYFCVWHRSGRRKRRFDAMHFSTVLSFKDNQASTWMLCMICNGSTVAFSRCREVSWDRPVSLLPPVYHYC